MDGLRIIPVTNEELIFSVSALADEIWHEHFSSILSTEQIDYMLEKFLSPEALADQINHDYEYFLFSYEYTFAGFAGIHEENGSLFLSKLYVHKNFRGKKIASYMFRKFIEICKMRNLNKIWLTCNRFNESTLAVYEHLGFQKVRTEVTDIGQGYVMDDYILEYKVE